jgi:tetratricopeptide (TPR) repeat protein
MNALRPILLSALCLVTIALTAASTQAQTFYDIEGVIDGPNSTPLGGVAVFLEDLTRARIGQTISSTDGRYRFSRIIAGTYYIVARPNISEFRGAVQRIELIDTSRSGAAASTERVDFNLEAIPRRPESVIGTLFAQDIPVAASAKFDHALDSLSKKDTAQAIKDLNDALAIFPNYFLASQQLGLIYVEAEEYQKAIPLLVKAIEVNAKAGSSYLALGIASLKLGRPDLALDALKRARSFDEKSFRVHFYLGLTLIELNRLDEAEAALKTSYQVGGAAKASSARLYLASIYSKRGQHQRAIEELETYLHESPKATNTASVKDAIAKLKAKL